MMVSWNHAFVKPVIFLLMLRHAGAAQRKQQHTLLRPRADLLEQHPFLATDCGRTSCGRSDNALLSCSRNFFCWHRAMRAQRSASGGARCCGGAQICWRLWAPTTSFLRSCA